jgi:nicotinate phosphoribosyltransferase
MITSILDNDLYKFTMQQIVLHQYPTAVAEYRFKNRGQHKFSPEFMGQLDDAVKEMAGLSLSVSERRFLRALPFIKSWYLDYLAAYRFNPKQVDLSLAETGELVIKIHGPWHETILWEVPLMATISELYFKYVDGEWNTKGLQERTASKGALLSAAGAEGAEFTRCKFADFGTRRRRSSAVHEVVLDTLQDCAGFVGTSNVHFAQSFEVKPIGTMAHEWVQAISALESINHANRYMMEKWADFYDGSLGIALTDTYGLRAFLVDFNPRLAKLFDGVRHDSGCPFEFTDRIVALYKAYGINPQSKTIVFSDGLDVDQALKIRSYCLQKGIGFSFGIGTNLTNDFPGSPPLNMVIKLWSINGMPVVKLSEDPGKANGDPEELTAVKIIYGA